MKKNELGVNFVSGGNSAILFRRIIKWLAVYGVIFVVVVAIVLIGASLANLYLDNRLASLDDEIEGQLQTIRNFSEFENVFLLTQEKLDAYEVAITDERMEDLLPILSLVAPVGVVLEEMVVFPNSVMIAGTVASQNVLATFVNNIGLISGELISVVDDQWVILDENSDVEEIDGDIIRVEFGNLTIDEISSLPGNNFGFNFLIVFDYAFR
ncbi:MAG: hypothetical protein LBG64_04595 [Pseudomonadales bacterium]|nr:hypothetical protein [Pseudomonadales bacterium]